MRVLGFACLAGLLAIPTLSQNPLRFRSDGTFKVVEVSDVHFTANLFCNDLSDAQKQYPCSDKNATEFWKKLILEEDADLFIFTGDNICNGDILGGDHSIEGMLADWISGVNKVPYVAVEGNHDGEAQGTNYAQVAAKLLTMPGILNQPNGYFAGTEIYGNTNFLITVLGPEGAPESNSSLLSLYMVDSNSYSTVDGIGGYGWVHLDQIGFFNNASNAVKAAAVQGGYPVPPALAFQHIPLLQHNTWVTDKNPIVGQYHEGVCNPEIDTGLLAMYIQSGDVKAVTVGHDHTNDFCTATPVDGFVTLCYDGHGSYGASGYGEPDWPIRARVWHISHFGSLITTYKHLDDLAGGAFPAANSTTIDHQVIFGTGVPLVNVSSSQTAGNPACPSGYTVVDTDMNRDAGGTYSYVCLERAASDAVGAGVYVTNVTAAMGTAASPTPVCPPGYTQEPANLKEGTKAAFPANLCVLVASVPVGGSVVLDIQVAQDTGSGLKCYMGYLQTSSDMSQGVGLHEVLCVKFGTLDGSMLERLERGDPKARLPARFQYSTTRPADKAPLAVQPKRRKPLEAGKGRVDL